MKNPDTPMVQIPHDRHNQITYKLYHTVSRLSIENKKETGKFYIIAYES